MYKLKEAYLYLCVLCLYFFFPYKNIAMPELFIERKAGIEEPTKGMGVRGTEPKPRASPGHQFGW